MVWQIEELGSELNIEPLVDPSVLHQREVQLTIVGTNKRKWFHVARLANWRRSIARSVVPLLHFPHEWIAAGYNIWTVGNEGTRLINDTLRPSGSDCFWIT